MTKKRERDQKSSACSILTRKSKNIYGVYGTVGLCVITGTCVSLSHVWVGAWNILTGGPGKSWKIVVEAIQPHGTIAAAT